MGGDVHRLHLEPNIKRRYISATFRLYFGDFGDFPTFSQRLSDSNDFRLSTTLTTLATFTHTHTHAHTHARARATGSPGLPWSRGFPCAGAADRLHMPRPASIGCASRRWIQRVPAAIVTDSYAQSDLQPRRGVFCMGVVCLYSPAQKSIVGRLNAVSGGVCFGHEKSPGAARRSIEKPAHAGPAVVYFI